jgi:hypothetical protein
MKRLKKINELYDTYDDNTENDFYQIYKNPTQDEFSIIRKEDSKNRSKSCIAPIFILRPPLI